MAVISEKELSQQNRALWLKATSAIETRNYGYAITLIQGILKESPEFLTGRQWLRRAEMAHVKPGKSFLGGGASLQVMKAQGSVKKDPKAGAHHGGGDAGERSPQRGGERPAARTRRTR